MLLYGNANCSCAHMHVWVISSVSNLHDLHVTVCDAVRQCVLNVGKGYRAPYIACGL